MRGGGGRVGGVGGRRWHRARFGDRGGPAGQGCGGGRGAGREMKWKENFSPDPFRPTLFFLCLFLPARAHPFHPTMLSLTQQKATLLSGRKAAVAPARSSVVARASAEEVRGKREAAASTASGPSQAAAPAFCCSGCSAPPRGAWAARPDRPETLSSNQPDLYPTSWTWTEAAALARPARGGRVRRANCFFFL